MKRDKILIPAEGKPTIHLRNHPADNRATTLRGSPSGVPNDLLASIDDHESFKGHEARQDFHPCRGKPTIHLRNHPADNRATTLRRSPLGVQNALLASIGDHEAFKEDMNRGMSFIPADGKLTIYLRAYSADRRATTLRRSPLGAPNALLANTR